MSKADIDKNTRTRSVTTLLGILFSFLTGLKLTIFLTAVSILFYTVFATLQPIIIQQSIYYVLNQPANNLLILLTAGFFIITILVWITQSLISWFTSSLNARLVENIREKTFQVLIDADMAYHHKTTSGDVTNRLVADTSEITKGLNIFTVSVSQLLLVIASLSILFYINTLFAVIALIGVPVSILLSRFFGKIGRKRSLRARQSYGILSGKMVESISGIGIYKTFNQEDRANKEFKAHTQNAYQQIKQVLKVSVLVAPTISFVSTGLVFGILLMGGYLFSLGGITSISIDIIFLGVIMTERFLTPINTIAQSYTQFQNSLASLDRVADVLEFEKKIIDGEDDFTFQNGNIRFENVSFSYEQNVEVLRSINFEVKSGEKIALIGQTGSGKSTIASLLHRFYDPTLGKIYIDDKPLFTVKLNNICKAIGFVTQEPYIFADTILENIRYGANEATYDMIEETCKLIGAHDFIDVLSDGYYTMVDQGGNTLSSGQKQMISIARVFISNPKIVILDEATSRLDAYTEAVIQRAQELMFKQRTTIIIAHRLSTIKNVDRILLIEDGTIQAYGSHDELITSNTQYQELYYLYYGIEGSTLVESE